MKILRSKLALSLLCLCVASAAWAQTDVYSINIVGYYNRSLFPGDNLFANQLVTPDTTLNTVLAAGVLDGSTLTKWDPVANSFLPASTFDASSATWSINYSLTYDDGAVLHSPADATSMFVGDVNQAFLNGDQVDFSNWHPNYGNGLYLLSCPLPMDGASFQDVVGRNPLDGEWVKTLDEADQLYSVTTFHTGTGWDNGAPALDVGQSAYFDLGPTEVPEPSTLALVTFGVAALLGFRQYAARSPVLLREPI